MCGIFGNLGRIDPILASHCTNALIHRGPDGGALFSNNDITLGHRRLSILDLSEKGMQPMWDASHRYCIVFNGEIYNFLELRDLLKSDYPFSTETDTEVVLAAFQKWGAEGFERFNGMWALAIWDQQKKELFLSRDRLGKKPLFYTFHKNGFAFASEMKALFPLLADVKPNPDFVGVVHQTYLIEKSENTLIQGIKKILPGFHGKVKPKDSSVQLTRWWCTLDHLVSVPTKYSDQVEAFRELFVDACKLRMRADVPLGTALSGGIDSSAIISVVAHLQQHQSVARSYGSPIKAFISSFPGTPLDELPYAQAVVEKHHLPSEIITVDVVKEINQLDFYNYLFEETYITCVLPFMLTYGKVKKSGVSVTLDGHGGDELFCGYTSDVLAAFQDVHWNFVDAYNIAACLKGCYPPNSPQFPDIGPTWKYAIKKMIEIDRARESRSLERVDSMDTGHAQWNTFSFLNQRLYMHTHDTTLPTLLRNYDRLSMSNGVEIRMPFLDHRLLSFAFSLPSTAKLRKGYTKAIIRDALADLLPSVVAQRKTKMGWSTPILDWMRGPMKEFLSDTIYSTAFKHCQWVQADSIQKKFETLVSDPLAKYEDAQNLWTEIAPYLWEKAVVKDWKIHFGKTIHPANKTLQTVPYSSTKSEVAFDKESSAFTSSFTK
jgi:asparagine synthase (glutamine-hydrolysing)